jgi:hypothetical protein
LQTATFSLGDEKYKITASARELKTYAKKSKKLKELVTKTYF